MAWLPWQREEHFFYFSVVYDVLFWQPSSKRAGFNERYFIQSYLNGFSRVKTIMALIQGQLWSNVTLSVLGAIKGKVISKMVGEKSRSVYRKKRKRNFSGRRKQKEESEETAPDVDEIAASTPSTSRDENQLSDSDTK